MKTKLCPYCQKEISDEAVLCKYCHNLLIDDDGNIKESEPAEELDDGRTRVFTKEEMNAFDDKTRAFVMPDSVIADEPAGGAQQENFAERQSQSYIPADDGYDDYDEEYEDDYEDEHTDSDADAKKRLFVITACITIGILVIVIAAIFVGMKLFGVKNDDSSSKVSAAPKNISSEADENSSEEVSDIIDSTVPDAASSVSSAEDSSTAEMSSAADTASSASDSSSETDDTSSKSDTASSEASSSTASVDSKSDTSSSAAVTDTPSSSVDESTVLAAAAGQIDGNVTSSEFRTDDGRFVYYYFFTDNGHGYSVAYNKTTGEAVVVQNY